MGKDFEKYERNKTLATTNSGVCVTCTDGDGNVLEYFGVIEDIIKISWEGREQLDLIFWCYRDGQPILYHARNWSHYSHTVRDDGQTPADRVKAEFWVSINFLPIAFFLQLSSSSALSRLMLDGFFSFQSIYSVPEELEDEADRAFEYHIC